MAGGGGRSVTRPGHGPGHDLGLLAVIATIPIFVWELSLGLWLVLKGFKPSPITAGMAAPTGGA